MSSKEEYEMEGGPADTTGEAPEVDDGALAPENGELALPSVTDDAVKGWERCGPVEDDLLVAALAAGRSLWEAAELAGVKEEVVLLRMSDIAFVGRVVAWRMVFRRAAEGLSSLPVYFLDLIRGNSAPCRPGPV